MTETSKTPTPQPIEDVVARDLSGWAQFIYNCTTGDNYFCTQEYYDLIRDLDRYASALTAAEAARDEAIAKVREIDEENGALKEKLRTERAECERLRADAGRYRAVRKWLVSDDPPANLLRDNPTTEAAVDAAIDAAMRGESDA